MTDYKPPGFDRLATVCERVNDRFKAMVFALPAGVGRLYAALLLLIAVVPGAAAAQSTAEGATRLAWTATLRDSYLVRPLQIGQVGDAICGTGLGILFTMVLAGVSMYLIAMSVIRGMVAFDKMGSSKSEKQREGKEALTGAGKTFAGAFVPLLFAGLAETIGLSTVSCLNFDIGLLVIGIPF